MSDLQRGSKVDYEPTIQHYEDIFREAGIEGLTIIPFNKLRNECNTFETVRKFGNTYDYFLCDGRLVGHASGFCGKVKNKNIMYMCNIYKNIVFNFIITFLTIGLSKTAYNIPFGTYG